MKPLPVTREEVAERLDVPVEAVQHVNVYHDAYEGTVIEVMLRQRSRPARDQPPAPLGRGHASAREVRTSGR